MIPKPNEIPKVIVCYLHQSSVAELVLNAVRHSCHWEIYICTYLQAVQA